VLIIRLMGRPRLERDGAPIEGARGNKTWALLARLVRSPHPVARQQLVDELFAEADDPMGALRWALAELRRRTGINHAFRGNPVVADLGDGAIVDVTHGVPGMIGEELPEGTFLEGIDVKGSPAFQTWLLIERQRIDSEVLSALRQAVLRAVASRQFERAVGLAGAMVRRSPFDEGPHVLLVKALAASGDAEAALRQVEDSEAMFRRSLGVEPSAAIRAAGRPSVASPLPGVPSRATSSSLREAGLAALSAGAADAGIECLRGATAAAETSGDMELLGECLMELGTALVHSIRGYDDEGSVILQQAVAAATDAGSERIAAKAMSELGYVDVLAGRRQSATEYLAQASELATGDEALVAAVAGFRAMNLSDWGRTDEAAEGFVEAVESSRSAHSIRREIWNLGVGARTLFLRGRFDEAVEWADRSCELAHDERWTAFRPWPEVWAAQARLARGETPEVVRHDVETTFALARQLHDPCWEGEAAKVLALTHLAEGRPELALDWIQNATLFCRRETDPYTWVSVEILVTEAAVARQSGDNERAAAVADRAMAEAAEGSMEDLLAQARDLGEVSRTGLVAAVPTTPI
jgi:DNA-binding SARP family transcriptional activator